MTARTVKSIGISLGTLLFVMALLSTANWGPSQKVASIGYALLLTFFLLAQVWGFVASQTTHVKDIENVKFDVLKAEGIECVD